MLFQKEIGALTIYLQSVFPQTNVCCCLMKVRCPFNTLLNDWQHNCAFQEPVTPMHRVSKQTVRQPRLTQLTQSQ